MPLTTSEARRVLDELNQRYQATHVVTYVPDLPDVPAWLALPLRRVDMDLMVSANDPVGLIEQLDKKTQDTPTTAFPVVGQRTGAYGAVA